MRRRGKQEMKNLEVGLFLFSLSYFLKNKVKDMVAKEELIETSDAGRERDPNPIRNLQSGRGDPRGRVLIKDRSKSQA